jgi:cbb3-type cytochrome oxidase subunit 3
MITFATAILLLLLLFLVAYLIFEKQTEDEANEASKPVSYLPLPLQLATAYNTSPVVRNKGSPMVN